MIEELVSLRAWIATIERLVLRLQSNDAASGFRHSRGPTAQMLMNQRVLLLLIAALAFIPACAPIKAQPDKSPENKVNGLAAPTKNTVAAPGPIPESPAPTANAEVNLETERSTLLETDLEFSRTTEEKGAAQAFYEFFTADGVCLFAGEPATRGRDTIKIHLAAGPQGFLSWQPTTAEVARSGDMGFTWGTAIFQTKGADEKPRISHSKYVIVWKKQGNGRWKVVLFSTSPSPPPAERGQ
jgi:ketosteroid isomerase-like protein